LPKPKRKVRPTTVPMITVTACTTGAVSGPGRVEGSTMDRVTEIHLPRCASRSGASLGVAHGDAAFKKPCADGVGGDVYVVADAGE
jgi:hypothetical protein